MPEFNILNKVDYPTKSPVHQAVDTVLFFPRNALGYEDITYKKIENAKDDQAQYQVSQALRVNNAFVRVLCALATLVLIVPTLIALAIKACLMKGQNEEIQKIEKVGTQRILNQSNASSSNSAPSTTSSSAAKKADSSKKDSSKLVGIDAQINIVESLDAGLKNQDLELIIKSLKEFSDEPNLDLGRDQLEKFYGKDFAKLRADFAKNKTKTCTDIRSRFSLNHTLRDFSAIKTYATQILDTSLPEARILETYSAMSDQAQGYVKERLVIFSKQPKQGSQQVTEEILFANEVLKRGMILVKSDYDSSPSDSEDSTAQSAVPARAAQISDTAAPSASVDNKARSTATPARTNSRPAASAPAASSAVPSEQLNEREQAKLDVIKFYQMCDRRVPESILKAEVAKFKDNFYAKMRLANDYVNMWPSAAGKMTPTQIFTLFEGNPSVAASGSAKHWKDLYPEFA